MIRAQDFIKGRIVEIYSTNSFLLENENSSPLKVWLNDTEPIKQTDEKYSKAMEYLRNRILDKEVYYTKEKEIDEILHVSIIYDCRKNDNEILNNTLPCQSANPLDIEMIQNGYVKYVGENESLKKIASLGKTSNY